MPVIWRPSGRETDDCIFCRALAPTQQVQVCEPNKYGKSPSKSRGHRQKRQSVTGTIECADGRGDRTPLVDPTRYERWWLKGQPYVASEAMKGQGWESPFATGELVKDFKAGTASAMFG